MFSHKTHKLARALPQVQTLTFIYPQEVVEEMRNFMITLKRTIAAATAAGLFALAGVSGAQAAEPTTPVVKKVALTPEQKAAHEAAKAAFKSAHVARKAAREAAKPAIESARATFTAARTAATTDEAKRAARDAFKAAVATAKAGIPAKPVKPVRP
jgi:hypothetical protein